MADAASRAGHVQAAAGAASPSSLFASTTNFLGFVFKRGPAHLAQKARRSKTARAHNPIITRPLTPPRNACARRLPRSGRRCATPHAGILGAAESGPRFYIYFQLLSGLGRFALGDSSATGASCSSMEVPPTAASGPGDALEAGAWLP
eukprot:scaffold12491_cov95-Isochrysis_galbana.AAC.2